MFAELRAGTRWWEHHRYPTLHVQPRPWRRDREGLESKGHSWCAHTQKDISICAQTAWESSSSAACTNTGPAGHGCACRETPTSLLALGAVRSTQTGGGDRSGSSQLDRSLGWVPVPALPAPGAPQEMHFTATSSKGIFLLPALPEGNCVTPGRFWGSKPFSIPSCPTACQTHGCPLSREQPSPSQRPGLSLLCHSGVCFMAWDRAHPSKSTFQRAFLPLCASLRTEIHLVGNMQFQRGFNQPTCNKWAGESGREAQLVCCQEQGRRAQSPPAVLTRTGQSTSSQT